jgi:flagellar hook-basal body complex protein FliE
MADPISSLSAAGAMMRPDAAAFGSAAAGPLGADAGRIAQDLAPSLGQRMIDGAQLADPAQVAAAGFLPSGPAAAPGGPGNSFQSILDAIDQADQAQSKSDVLSRAFSQGQDVPIHQVMAASEEASLALETLTALRNKSLDALNELMRIQV